MLLLFSSKPSNPCLLTWTKSQSSQMRIRPAWSASRQHATSRVLLLFPDCLCCSHSSPLTGPLIWQAYCSGRCCLCRRCASPGRWRAALLLQRLSEASPRPLSTMAGAPPTPTALTPFPAGVFSSALSLSYWTCIFLIITLSTFL